MTWRIWDLFLEHPDCLEVLRCLAEAEEEMAAPELSARTGMSIPAVCSCLGYLEAHDLIGTGRRSLS